MNSAIRPYRASIETSIQATRVSEPAFAFIIILAVIEFNERQIMASEHAAEQVGLFRPYPSDSSQAARSHAVLRPRRQAAVSR